MKLEELIEQLQNVKDSLKDKEVFVVAENGLLMEPKIKSVLIDYRNAYDQSEENVKCLIVSYQH